VADDASVLVSSWTRRRRMRCNWCCTVISPVSRATFAHVSPSTSPPSEAEDEDQHVGRVERVTGGPSGFEELAGFLD
jgi:hypothetical protein